MPEDKEEVIRSIVQKYIHEGLQKELEKGLDKGRAEGIERGIEKAAVNILKKGADIKFIIKVTGLSIEQLQRLKASI